jgi:hypothetical protein
VQDEDRCERQRDERDLVAEQRDRLAEPEAPEGEVPEKARELQLYVSLRRFGRAARLALAAAILPRPSVLVRPTLGSRTAFFAAGRP